MPRFECLVCGTVLTVAQNQDAPFRPFCSRRCKLIDLGRWLDGTYAVSEPVIAPDPQKEAPVDTQEDAD